jgi:hypothetical protein
VQSVDYKGLFGKVLYEEMGRILAERHIDTITEEQLDGIVAECYRKVFHQSIAEFMRATGRTSSRTEWVPMASRIGGRK